MLCGDAIMRLGRVAATLMLGLLLTAVGAHPVRRGAQPPLSRRLDEAVRSEVLNGFSGAVLVARGDTVLLDMGYGAVRGVTMRSNSRFWIASVGKQFTSAAILKCADRRRLSLDDRISRFFPEAPADKRNVTVKQLLAHLSGLDQSYVSEGQTDRSGAVRCMFAQSLIDRPGHAFHYSNSNYQLAVAIVEIVSGDDYRAFVNRELLRPSGLYDTGFNATPGARSVVPGRKELPERLRATSWGGEGYFSTTHDLFRWYRALHGGGVLSVENAKALFTPVTTIQEGEAALGWFVGSTTGGVARVFTRGNEDWGPNALLYAYPESQVVIVVLTHAGNANDDVSWSRFIHAKLERIMFPTGGRPH